MNNIVTFLRILLTNGKDQAKYNWYDNNEIFSAPWAKSIGFNDIHISLDIPEDLFEYLSDEEILDVYKNPIWIDKNCKFQKDEKNNKQ